MDKDTLWKLAEKIGTKKENFEFGYKEDKENMEKAILSAAEHMGWLEESEDDEEDVE